MKRQPIRMADLLGSSRQLIGLWMAVMLLLTGCGPSKDFAGDGRFHKRTLRPGWHVDLGSRKHTKLAVRVSDRPEVTLISPIDGTVAFTDSSSVAVTSSLNGGLEQVETLFSALYTDKLIPLSAETDLVTSAVHEPASVTDPVQENLFPKKKWNHWAIPALLAALGTVAFGFFSTDILAVGIGVLVTLLLAAIAIRRGRSHELAGKGFAIAALLIGVTAALFTAIILIVVGL